MLRAVCGRRAFAALVTSAVSGSIRPVAAAGRHFSTSSDLTAQIKETIATNKVTIYSKSTCPFCRRTKDLFDSLDQEFTAIELDQRDDGSMLQAALHDFTGQRTVPNVFVAGEHIGGNDDTQRAAASGKLAAFLK